MLILAKLAGILVLVWFYLNGKKQGEPAVKWAVIGLFGYWLAWWIGNKLILFLLKGIFFTKSATVIFLFTQLPVLCGLAVAYLVRNKLIKDAEKNSTTASNS